MKFTPSAARGGALAFFPHSASRGFGCHLYDENGEIASMVIGQTMNECADRVSLFSAAPELLAALKEMLDGVQHSTIDSVKYEKAISAVSNAERKQ